MDPEPGRPDPLRDRGQGHEAAQVGTTWALQKGQDWIAPFYRSIATCLTFGMSAKDIMLAHFAQGHRPVVGRPADARPLRRPPPQHPVRCSPVATQILHAVGIALAARVRGERGGAHVDRRRSSNQGEVHEAINFAAIHRLPFIFLVENNGYAISVPRRWDLGA